MRLEPSVPRQMVATITTLVDNDWREAILKYLQSSTVFRKMEIIKKKGRQIFGYRW